MGKRTFLTLTFALLLVSCTDSDTGTSTTSAAATTAAPEAPSDAGRLVVLDGSGDIVVMEADGSGSEAVTDDAGEAAVYTQPIWSPDASTLAWGQATEEGFAVGIHQPGEGEPATVPTSNLPFFMYWSPDGRNLGVLHNGRTGVEFRMVDVGEGTSQSLDEDAPFYFSWSPEGDRLVTHAGPTRSETLTPEGERSPLAPTAATYLAPQWTPAGVFHVVDDRIVLEDEDGGRAPVAEVSGLTMFVANPEGTLVALQAVGDGGDVTAATEEFPTVATGSVVVVDVESGEADVVSSELSLAFFWSPDGQSLLVLTPGEASIVPRVWDRDGHTDYEAYVPPGVMLENTFPFFPQYAQSLRFWAADSSAFAYAGRVGDENGIWVQGLDATAPDKVSDGSWVAWSPARP